jgi:hypothetical protein
MSVIVDRELLVAERLAASGRGDLWPLLVRLAGHELPGGWVLGEPIGVGGRGLVLAARGSGGEAAVKLPLLDYHRPWTYGREAIDAARAHLAQEAAVLELLAPDLELLPRFLALARAPCPLHACGRGVEALGDDHYLVMERIHGEPLAERLAHQDEVGRAVTIARTVDALLHAWGELSSRGGLYTDVKPEHVVLTDRGPRLLDAGSIWLPGHASVAHTLAEARGASGAEAAARAARSSLAATLYEAWTGRAASTRPTEPAEWRGAPGWLRELVSALEVDGAAWSDIVGLVQVRRGPLSKAPWQT